MSTVANTKSKKSTKNKADNDSSKITELPAYRLVEKLKTGELSSLEVTEAHLARIESENPKYNALVIPMAEEARKAARQADKDLAAGKEVGPLHGLPMTVKDHFAIQGVRSTNSHPPLAEHRPDYNATVIERLKAAGAVIMGKTNLSWLAMDFQCISPVHGVSNNPWDPSRTPGGSSGGSAASLAARLAPLEVGTDLAGSLRIPASFCGVTALKPTENRVSLFGVAPGLPEPKYQTFRHMGNAGPMARTVRDLRMTLPIIAGPDRKKTEVVPNEIPLLGENAPKTRRNLKDDISRLKIAYCEGSGAVPVARDIKRSLSALATGLKAEGASVSRLEIPDNFLERAWRNFGLLVDLELNIHNPAIARFMTFAFGAGFRRQVPQASIAYPATYSKYMRALTEREELIIEMEEMLEEYDVLLCPVTSTTSFLHHEPSGYMGPIPLYKKPLALDEGEISYYQANMSHTTPFNVTGHPVLSMPVGFDTNGLPVGAQLVAKKWDDQKLLETGEIIETYLDLGERLRPDIP